MSHFARECKFATLLRPEFRYLKDRIRTMAEVFAVARQGALNLANLHCHRWVEGQFAECPPMHNPVFWSRALKMVMTNVHEVALPATIDSNSGQNLYQFPALTSSFVLVADFFCHTATMTNAMVKKIQQRQHVDAVDFSNFQVVTTPEVQLMTKMFRFRGDRRRRRWCLNDEGQVLHHTSACPDSRQVPANDYRTNVYPIRQCPQCESGQDEPRKLLWNRDVNADRNMRRILEAYMAADCQLDSIPEALRRA
ncbi:uncharacterized protein BYT42DRAFT_604125 [Radiomyces spectabilis]|uniref:uncharacterized protein n=1 Tax=Radiomyces spectabilis TaxID=64574 RepID=UPI00221E720E|nr:uncharacterized protein BYT42DRAFT_604125 [Radiomyces spectabilis]KAI8381090.1 hypothetical protein BYT42DRAFT_604125 [Radiomyces spectabilis]